ncbi:MAG: helix-turn-helix transcriptional regulator, partial [Novosphingobium sp.]|nr:helix-turn-helix transcriptional regulator [Novosphingobium sp.]
MKDKRPIRAQRIRARMAELKMDQGDLADVIGVTQGTISLILTCKTKDSRHFPAIARYLGLNLDYVMGNTDTRIE